MKFQLKIAALLMLCGMLTFVACKNDDGGDKAISGFTFPTSIATTKVKQHTTFNQNTTIINNFILDHQDNQ